MYALVISIFVYGTGNQIISTDSIVVPGFTTAAFCQAAVVKYGGGAQANSKRTAYCIEVH